MYWINTIIQGALVGGLYALFATGLSLMFGVMRIINLAHGDFIVLSAYLAIVVMDVVGVNPLWALAIVAPLMFVVGYVLQRGLLNFTLGGDILRPLLVTFGLSVVIQNVLLELFSADSRRLQLPWLEMTSVRIGDQLAIGLMPATVFVVAVVVISAIEISTVSHRFGPRVSCHLGRYGHSSAVWGQQSERLCLGDRNRACGRVDRRRPVRHSHHIRSDHRPGSAALRFRSRHYRRLGKLVGNSRRRRHPRCCAGRGRSFRSELGHARRARGLPDRAAHSAARAHSKDFRSMKAVVYQVDRSTRAGRVGFAIMLVAVCVLLSVPAWAGRAEMRLLIEVSYYLALAQAWNLLAGYAGLVSVGQQAFVGLGCYGFIIATVFLQIPPLAAIPLTAFGVGVIAIPTAFLAFRLRGAHFAIGTWVLAEVLRLIFTLIKPFGAGTGMSLPIAVVRDIAESRVIRELILYYVSLAVGIGTVILIFLWLRSRQGLALTAIRDSESAAGSIGINQQRTKLAVYLIAALIAGLVGCLVVLEKLRITPAAAFSVTDWSADVIFIVIIGGIGSIEGPIIGTLVFFALRFFLADYGAWYLITVGTIAIIVMLRAPRGIWGLIEGAFNIHLFPVQRHVRLGSEREGQSRLTVNGVIELQAPSEQSVK